MPDEMRFHARVRVVAHQRRNAVFQFRARVTQRFALGHAETKREHVAQKRVRQAICFFARARAKHAKTFGLQIAPIIKFVQQTRFADARIADDGNDVQRFFLHHRAQCVAQRVEFGLTSNHARLDAFDSARIPAKNARLGSEHQIRLQRFAFAFDRQQILRTHFKRAAHMAIRIMRNQNAADGRGVFDARCHIHRVAHRRKFALRADRAQHDRARVDADAHLNRALLRRHERVDFVLHCERRANRLLGVVFVRDGHAPQCHHRIAHVLVNFSAVRIDDMVKPLPQRVDHRGHFFRVNRFRKRGKARNVRKQHRRLFALFGKHGRIFERRNFRAQRGDGNIRRDIAKHFALAFQQGDGLFQFRAFAVVRIHKCIGYSISLLAQKMNHAFWAMDDCGKKELYNASL